MFSPQVLPLKGPPACLPGCCVVPLPAPRRWACLPGAQKRGIPFEPHQVETAIVADGDAAQDLLLAIYNYLHNQGFRWLQLQLSRRSGAGGAGGLLLQHPVRGQAAGSPLPACRGCEGKGGCRDGIGQPALIIVQQQPAPLRLRGGLQHLTRRRARNAAQGNLPGRRRQGGCSSGPAAAGELASQVMAAQPGLASSSPLLLVARVA
jgi:hypothetical protein